MSGLKAQSRPEREPVMITGMAAVSPLGNTCEAIADNLFAGR